MQDASSRFGKMALGRISLTFVPAVWLKILILITIFALAPYMLLAETITVGISQNPPKTYWREGGEVTGIFVDILDHIANQEGWEINYVKDTWENNLRLLEQNKLDLVADVAFSPERAEIMDFHQIPVLFSWSQIYASKGVELRTIEDIDGLRIAVLRGSIQEDVLADIVNAFKYDTVLVSVEDFIAALNMVRDGLADGAAVNYYFGRMNARSYDLHDTDILFEPSALYFAAPKGSNEHILKTVDKYLGALKRRPDTVYYSILQRHTSEAHKHGIPRWLTWGGAMLLIALLVSLGVIMLFRHKVNQRTKELKQANLEMERRIEERTEELSLAMQKAQVADMLKSAFLATMSHELRTPLNSVIGFTGILLKQMPGQINEEQKKMLGIVQKSAKHLLDLINDVLDISKIEAGQLELHYSDLPLAPMLESLVMLLAPQAAEKGIDLVLKTSPNPQSIRTDGRRLEQVIINLLSNAVKFTEKGEVEISYTQRDDKLVLRVKDTGIGIPEDKIDRIFHPFIQLDSGNNRKYEGSGLGLFIAQRIVAMMGGEITLQSRLNKGSTFTVEIPVKGGGESCKDASSS